MNGNKETRLGIFAAGFMSIIFLVIASDVLPGGFFRSMAMFMRRLFVD